MSYRLHHSVLDSKPLSRVFAVLCPGALNKDKNQKLLAFAAGLKKLMTDVAHREALGAASRDYCAAHYSRGTILDQWESLLHRIVAP